MPKHKINKKDAVTFQLVHRSQQDPLIADDSAPQRVLLPVKYNESKGSNRVLAKQELLENEDHTDGDEFEEEITLPIQGFAKSKEVKFKLELPPVVFPSEVEEEVGMLGKAAPVSGPQLHLDPDVIAAMDEDFDYSDPENELEDNFIELANGDDLTGEYNNIDGFCNSEDDDEEWNGGDFDKEETKSRFTNYSITSSAIRRNDQLRLLDEKFEKMFVAYEENEIGALDLEEIEGVESSNVLLDSALNEFNKASDNLKIDKNNINKNMGALEDISEGEETEDQLVAVQSSKRKWDCESILSSYSNIYNHPKKITEPKDGKIRISRKTGIPCNVLRKNELTTKTLDKLNQQNEKMSETESIPDHTSQLSMLSQRPQHESPEDRRIRKQKLKEYRKERRVEKKLNSQAFKDESKKQAKIAINNRNNVQDMKPLHFGVYDLSGRVEECVVEGENVLNAGHLILTGKTQEHFGNIELYGLCPQSSSIDSNPQEITEKLCITIFE